ncbi:restriction endonuclease subunit S [Macellibacteroides fermentans]|uniref:restriction endonuclease subunit S n=1 Tax=Macellibacteroides fermentans TaxID=879969 RepID=UPI00406BFB34
MLLREIASISANGFINYILSTEKFLFFFFAEAKGGTGNQTNVSTEDVKNISLGFPHLSEQTKIATFLTAVDEKLTQLKKKKTLLEQYKKGVMQKLFSQELRFKDENNQDFPDWQEKKIGEILTIGSGKDYKHLSEGNIPVFGTGGLMTRVNDYLYEGETVCIGRKGTIDKPMYYSGKIWTVDTLFYTHSFINSYPKFVYCIFLMINWKEYNEASGVPSLSKSTIESIQINIPSLPEQQKIATFLSSIDEKISHCGKQIEKMETWKKGLLQQMFC